MQTLLAVLITLGLIYYSFREKARDRDSAANRGESEFYNSNTGRWEGIHEERFPRTPLGQTVEAVLGLVAFGLIFVAIAWACVSLFGL